MEYRDEDGEIVATDTFTMVCHECEPPRTINFVNGERVPSACSHQLPVVQIGHCDD